MGVAVLETESMGFEAWCKANGYDPELRKYEATADIPCAVPRSHPGTHYPNGRMKVA